MLRARAAERTCCTIATAHTARIRAAFSNHSALQVACTLRAYSAYSKPTKACNSDESDGSYDDSDEGDLVLEQHGGLTFVWGCTGAALRVPHPPISHLLVKQT